MLSNNTLNDGHSSILHLLISSVLWKMPAAKTLTGFGEDGFTAPMFGPKMWATTDVAAELEAEILAETPVTLAHFDAARMAGTRRLGRLLLTDCTVEKNETLQGLTISFSLPKGAFATTILRELMKVEVAQLPEMDDEDEG